MAEEIKINKHDYNRVVLTEVQPYELPFIITNEGFYANLKLLTNQCFFDELFGYMSETRPFDFKITKTHDSFRKLSLIHPFGQSKFISFYRKYNSLIKSKCNESKYSLRYPVDIALFYYESKNEVIDTNLKDEGVDLHSVSNAEVPAYASSFFTYKKYNFLYKFYDSYSFHRLERKFDKLHKFDISKCFESLSTEMLSIALRGEESVRSTDSSHNTFEKVFSDLISYVNYGRTHGIVIGPEFSRIYAELLLQSVDKNVYHELLKRELKYGRDYVIKRYVDDYFLFYNDSNLLHPVKTCVTDHLSELKLFINESKNEDFSRPFITGVTRSKLSISEYFEELFDKLTIDVKNDLIETSSTFFNYTRISNRFITKIKSIVAQHHVNYESVSGYFLTVLRRKVTEINEVYSSSSVDSETTSSISRFLLLLIEVMFFIYSMDGRVRATYLVSEIIVQISEISKNLSYEYELMISDKIFQEAKFSIKNFSKGIDKVESLNLALALSCLNTENSLSVTDVRNILSFNEKSKNINYFQLIVGLYFIKNNSKYYSLKMEMCSTALDKILHSKNALQDSEMVHIIFDLISCPFLSEKYKWSFISELEIKGVLPSNVTNEVFYKQVSTQKWFVDWSELSIKRLLKKKQLRSPY